MDLTFVEVRLEAVDLPQLQQTCFGSLRIGKERSELRRLKTVESQATATHFFDRWILALALGREVVQVGRQVIDDAPHVRILVHLGAREKWYCPNELALR